MYLSSIFTAKAFAIGKALDDIIQNSTKNHYAICSDTRIHRILKTFKPKVQSVFLHLGIKGNQEADKAAKQTTMQDCNKENISSTNAT